MWHEENELVESFAGYLERVGPSAPEELSC